MTRNDLREIRSQIRRSRPGRAPGILTSVNSRGIIRRPFNTLDNQTGKPSNSNTVARWA